MKNAIGSRCEDARTKSEPTESEILFLFFFFINAEESEN